MPTIDYNKVMKLATDLVKTAADGSFTIVGPGEDDPDSGETDNSPSITAFARVDSVRITPRKKIATSDSHLGELEVTVMIFCTDKTANPITDAAADIRNVINALENTTREETVSSVSTRIHMMSAQMSEQTQDRTPKARGVAVIGRGSVRAQSV
jgi:hypothetical protein